MCKRNKRTTTLLEHQPKFLMSIAHTVAEHYSHALVSMYAMEEASASLSPRCRRSGASSLAGSIAAATIIFICAHNKARYYTTCTHAWLPARRWRERASEQVSCNRQRGMAALRRWAQPTSLGVLTTRGVLKAFKVTENGAHLIIWIMYHL